MNSGGAIVFAASAIWGSVVALADLAISYFASNNSTTIGLAPNIFYPGG
jgi:hypothetical protein